MFPFFQYSLESAFCLAVLLLPYLAWFRKTTFYQWNRFYLLGAVSFSLLAPLVNIEIGTTTSKVPQLTETLSFFQGVHMLSSQTSSKGQLPIDTKTTSHTPSKIDTLEAVEQTTSWNWEQLHGPSTSWGFQCWEECSFIGYLCYGGWSTEGKIQNIRH